MREPPCVRPSPRVCGCVHLCGCALLCDNDASVVADASVDDASVADAVVAEYQRFLISATSQCMKMMTRATRG